ncbi:rhodanese-related sulfurtransferase [Hyphomicrobium sp. D-2]|uniref:oxygen-dependent tRNA uridine(34) hydroxylase TrhO n=1 Tax=Hyphomicrobium sp. D-2 TaxID=3041621 RepID=UPI0024566629|nr:rhodanese-related sulfurtransferase [Hyphomicrobium sp. D-2]MDH4982867.1 rhodanese-related sulfurtransferase [Hyphomicrobium sp. D-2]
MDLPICVAALYKFHPIDDCAAAREPLAKLCCSRGVKGTLLLAREGINGTIAGSDEAIAEVLDHVRGLVGEDNLEVKFSRAKTQPFYRMKVRIKHEIVTMGEPDIDPRRDVGQYIQPEQWNALIQEPGTILIDTRNDYEVEVGTFAGAINPQTKTFREFPAWFKAERERLLGQGTAPKVAMFCTGGIRCEKATAYLKAQGLDEVYHLHGGILKYLETIPAEQSLWEGECFVFDERVTVGHGLELGHYALCRACRRPLRDEDRTSPLFEDGVSCPACHGERSDEQRARYRERQKQERLAAERGATHIGANPNERADEEI